MKATKDDIKGVLTGIIARANAEIQQASQQDLERYWHFKWNGSASLESNLYQFHKMLSLYGSSCRRWEEAHNGGCCVVERVRDTYLMPKIREFAENIRLLPNNECAARRPDREPMQPREEEPS